jgi:hypothetical protein
MMSHDFRQYAELWQEQIDPEELAELQAMAKIIERTAARRRLIDSSLMLGFIGPVGVALWIYPASVQVRFGFVLIGVALAWGFWRRHELTRASRATAIHDPRVFFEKAIKNVRAEVRMSTISLCLAVPALIGCFSLMSALRGFAVTELILLELRGPKLAKTVLIVIILVLAAVYFVRDNIRLREQLRWLETMRREWDEQSARDLAEGA